MNLKEMNDKLKVLEGCRFVGLYSLSERINSMFGKVELEDLESLCEDNIVGFDVLEGSNNEGKAYIQYLNDNHGGVFITEVSIFFFDDDIMEHEYEDYEVKIVEHPKAGATHE